MPFPSPQGTQAAFAAMLHALQTFGHNPEALCYHGQAKASVPWKQEHVGTATARSGPSFQKVASDALFVRRLMQDRARLTERVTIAHNIEAALAARAAAIPYIYFAHTRFDTELPTYFPSRLSRAFRHAGRQLDEFAARGALHTFAISPALATYINEELKVPCTSMLPAWNVSEAPSANEREQARSRLGLVGPVAAYVGNLDNYQGWELAAQGALQAGVQLVVATESDPRPLRPFRPTRLRLRDEVDRRLVYAAADVVLVPRRAAGGLPIKLLDALARDVPAVACHRALAGLDPTGVVRCDNDSAEAFASGIREVLRARPCGGQAWLNAELSPQGFAIRFQRALAGVESLQSKKRPV